jgi:hypothetical protein
MGTVSANFEYLVLYNVWLGSDCANFISQALYAGGIEVNEDWHYYKIKNKLITSLGIKLGSINFKYKKYIDNPLYGPMYLTQDGAVTHRYTDYNFTPSWSMASKQYEYFSDPTNGYINGEVIIIKTGSKEEINNAIENGIQIGDLLFWSWNGNSLINHSSMITEIKGDEIKYSAHTTARKDFDLFEALEKDLSPKAWVYIVKIRDSAK